MPVLETHSAELISLTESRITLKVDPSAPYFWVCKASHCHVIQYGFVTEDAAATASILHARSVHPLIYSELTA